MPIKQSFCYPIFKEEGRSLSELFNKAADIGYQATEIWQREDNYEELVEAAHGAGLVVASMVGHGSIEEGLNKNENHSRIEDELKESIDLAAKHDIPGLICFSGERNPGQSDEEGAEICVEGLKRIVGYAEEKGINLNIELLNSKVDHYNYQCDNTPWGVKVCRLLDSPRVKLLYDIYHMQIMEGDIIRTIENNIDHIGHFHTAGNPGRKDMDETQELNYVPIMKMISSLDYDLYVGHEFWPKGDKIEALESAYKLCDVEGPVLSKC